MKNFQKCSQFEKDKVSKDLRVAKIDELYSLYKNKRSVLRPFWNTSDTLLTTLYIESLCTDHVGSATAQVYKYKTVLAFENRDLACHSAFFGLSRGDLTISEALVCSHSDPRSDETIPENSSFERTGTFTQQYQYIQITLGFYTVQDMRVRWIQEPWSKASSWQVTVVQAFFALDGSFDFERGLSLPTPHLSPLIVCSQVQQLQVQWAFVVSIEFGTSSGVSTLQSHLK